MAFLDTVFDPIFGPVLQLGPFWALLIFSLLISLIIVLVYKYFTNQQEMKRLKEQQKEFQKKMKELKSDPEAMMKVQKEAMGVNMQYMKHSLKATLITMLPVILIFGWMNSHLANEPIFPGEPYGITASFAAGVSGTAELIVDQGTELLSEAQPPIASPGVASWRLKSTEGSHTLTVKTGQEQQSKEVLIAKELRTAPAFTSFKNSAISSIKIDYNKLRPLGDFSLFGWQPGWLGWYIIFSLLFSIALRKVLKVY